ncbi:hypothetical protein Tco_0605447 [Tanacetum coccineum]
MSSSMLKALDQSLRKSLLGVAVRSEDVNVVSFIAWDDTIGKLKARLSNWKLKTLSVGGRLTLLKSVLGSTPIYNMSIYKVPKSVLQTMESIRRNFFNGVQCDERKIVWIKWAKVLASKKYGGYFLWCRLIMLAWYSLYKYLPFRYSTWKSIIREVHMLKDRGVDLISHCHIRVGNGLRTQFWNEVWIGDTQLRVMFPRRKIPRTCFSVADWLRISPDSYAAGGIYHGRPLVHMLIGLIGSIPSD